MGEKGAELFQQLCAFVEAQIAQKGVPGVAIGILNQDQPVSPPPPPVSLALCEKDRPLITAGPGKGARADVVRNPDGTIGWLRIGRIHRRLEKRPARES